VWTAQKTAKPVTKMVVQPASLSSPSRYTTEQVQTLLVTNYAQSDSMNQLQKSAQNV
jgi:hypothetical protein